MPFLNVFIPDNNTFQTFPITITATNQSGESVPSDPFEINPYIPQSIVCFEAGTEILCDQGYVEIQNLEPGKHSFGSENAFLCLTKTRSLYPFLIQIDAHAIDFNVPSKTIITTYHHKIQYNNEMIEAGKLLHIIEKGISAIEYKNQYLYNIVLEKQKTLLVSNMVSETLPKDCEIAKYFLKIQNNSQINYSVC